MVAKKTNTVGENTDNITNISIEDGFQRLNELLNNMEAEDIGLEASFDLYKQGVELVKVLNGRLDDVEGKLNEVNDVQ
ncbi:MAG: exodeoxyribonuclease VII small subunit [Lachnospiraceae bacterium]|nr:exodeoxyribonuclease VII small subunit [Lachnospiraceae bacterium]